MQLVSGYHHQLYIYLCIGVFFTFQRLLFNFMILTNTTGMSHLKFGIVYCVIVHKTNKNSRSSSMEYQEKSKLKLQTECYCYGQALYTTPVYPDIQTLFSIGYNSRDLLSFGAESVAFQVAIQKLKDQDIQNYNFARGFVWV